MPALPFQQMPRWCWNGMCWACSCPAFFTGHLIKRFGAAAGDDGRARCSMPCASALALSGVDLDAVPGGRCLLLGVGWNFLYTGGTTLLTTRPTGPRERNRAQGVMDTCVFCDHGGEARFLQAAHHHHAGLDAGSTYGSLVPHGAGDRRRWRG
jgi:hypothetical protein